MTTHLYTAGGTARRRWTSPGVGLAVTIAVVLAGVGAGALYLTGPWVPRPVAGAGPSDDVDDDAVAKAERLAEEQRLAEEARQAQQLADDEAARIRAADEQLRTEEERRLEAERLAEEERLEAERQAEEARLAEQERVERLRAAQERLQELGYLVGTVDGEQGQQTTAALMAFQAVNGIQVDGILGPQTEATLVEPLASPQLQGGPADRIEVDLDRQILHLVEGGERVVTLKVSSGNGGTYRTLSGGTARSLTPVGTYTIERRIAGVRESSAGLGTLYDPMYFYRGFAIHGSNSVPAGPASHGCVRVSRADAVWLFHRVPNGTPVHLYGGVHVFTPR